MARFGFMSRKIKLTQEELAWLRGNHHSLTLHELADRYSVCVDTVKRLLVKLELQYFPGAKYQVKPSPPVWRRPCLICGNSKPRPKNQYMCDNCTTQGSSSLDLASSDVKPKRQPYTPKVPF